MRLLALAALGLPMVLSACALTPRQQCQAPYFSELNTVREELRATELRLQRGYRLEPARFEFGLHYCERLFGAVHLCSAEDGEPMFDKRPISRAAETAKRDALLQEQLRLNEALAQCAVQYPEVE
ncbi:MAG: hypothetical protein P8X51_01510 [Maritimibacter sp.]